MGIITFYFNCINKTNVGCSVTLFICLIIVIEQPPFIVIEQPPFVLNKQDKNTVIAIEIINI